VKWQPCALLKSKVSSIPTLDDRSCSNSRVHGRRRASPCASGSNGFDFSPKGAFAAVSRELNVTETRNQQRRNHDDGLKATDTTKTTPETVPMDFPRDRTSYRAPESFLPRNARTSWATAVQLLTLIARESGFVPAEAREHQSIIESTMFSYSPESR